MTSARHLSHWNWVHLYTAAMSEGDADKLPSRISEAERAIVERARELFKNGKDNIQEEEGLDDALYGLTALKSCLATYGKFADAD